MLCNVSFNLKLTRGSDIVVVTSVKKKEKPTPEYNICKALPYDKDEVWIVRVDLL